jgi:hypothetical protein
MLPHEQETGRKAYLSIASYQDMYALLFTIIQNPNKKGRRDAPPFFIWDKFSKSLRGKLLEN